MNDGTWILFWKAETMGQRVAITVICLLICAGGLAVSAWLIATGQIARQGIDALFLLAVALVMTFCFALIPVHEIRRGLLREVGERLRAGRASKAAARESLQPAENPEAKQPTLPGAH
jgi:hypothetical protein